jgi:hypothetical protein
MESVRVLLDSDILETDGETFPHYPKGLDLDVTAAKG